VCVVLSYQCLNGFSQIITRLEDKITSETFVSYFESYDDGKLKSQDDLYKMISLILFVAVDFSISHLFFLHLKTSVYQKRHLEIIEC